MALQFLPSSASSGSTKRSLVAIGSAGVVDSSNPSGLDATCRNLVLLPVTTTRWRLRFRNTNPRTGAAKTGPITLTGVAVGSPAVPASNISRWDGSFSAAPAQAITSQTLPSDGSEWTSAWVTDPTLQFNAYQRKGVSYGITSGGSALNTFYDVLGFSWTDAGSSSHYADQAKPSGSVLSIMYSDVRIEYECVTTMPLVLALGTSITQGYGVSAYRTDGVPTGFPHEAWPGAAGLVKGLVTMNLGIGSSYATDWLSLSGTQYTRADLATTVPDAAIVELGTNDVSRGDAEATIEGNIASVVTLLRSLGISRVGLGTVIPRSFAGATETTRLNVNAWMGSMAELVDFVVDFTKVIENPTSVANMDTTLVSTIPHPNARGYQRMAAIVPSFK